MDRDANTGSRREDDVLGAEVSKVWDRMERGVKGARTILSNLFAAEDETHTSEEEQESRSLSPDISSTRIPSETDFRSEHSSLSDLQFSTEEVEQLFDELDISSSDSDHRGFVQTACMPVTGSIVEQSGNDLIYREIPPPPIEIQNIRHISQRRVGGRHGRGGRKKTRTDATRVFYSTFVARMISEYMVNLAGGAIPFAESLMKTLQGDFPQTSEESIVAKIRTVSELTLEMMENPKGTGMEVIYGPLLVVATKFSPRTKPSRQQGEQSEVRERHICCTWLDERGLGRCTCIGSTEYVEAIRMETLDPLHVSRHCRHVQSFLVLRKWAVALGISVHECGKLLTKVIFSFQPDSYTDVRNNLPLFTYCHAAKTAVLMVLEREEYGIQFIPIRCRKRSAIKYLCAFCDILAGNECRHIHIFSALRTHGGAIGQEGNGTEYRPGESNTGSSFVKEIEESSSISQLPLCLVNCSRAIRLDEHIAALAKGSKPLKIMAPAVCPECGGGRNEGAHVIHIGVVYSSTGVGRMELEEFQCLNCGGKIRADGREFGILIHTVTTAATHVMLRNELLGVVLNNGALLSRLQQYHSRMVANIQAGIIPSDPGSRSVRTLFTLCMAMCKLMVMDPPKTLFDCDTCNVEESGKRRFHAICIDGIWAGYLRRSHRPFKNASENCKALPSSAAKSQKLQRPLQNLFRQDQTGYLLLQAIRGKPFSLKDTQYGNCVSAVRLVQEEFFDASYYPDSICGSNPTDYSNDDEDGIVSHLREFIKKLFDTELMIYRLTKEMLPCISAEMNFNDESGYRARRGRSLRGGRTRVRGGRGRGWGRGSPRAVPEETHRAAARKMKEFVSSFRILQQMNLSRLVGTESGGEVVPIDRDAVEIQLFENNEAESEGHNPLDEVDERQQERFVVETGTERCYNDLDLFFEDDLSICWLPNVIVSTDEDSLKELFLFIKCVMQGPSTHFVLRTELQSLKRLISACMMGRSAVLQVIERIGTEVPTAFNTTPHWMERGSSRDILSRFRLLRRVVVTILDLDESIPTLLTCFAAVLRDIYDRVSSFYAFYDSCDFKSESAVAYAREWGTADEHSLRTRFQLKYQDLTSNSTNLFKEACETGVFFPSKPQIRPLPFNDEVISSSKNPTDSFGLCSKHYLQKRAAFTPGAITLSCTCPHPVHIGLKCLEKREGPRVVLDLLLSRFSQLPRHVIYDFACGVYSSAIHTLWWALEDSVVVSDAFHGQNHLCAPDYLPTMHKSLNMVNTVSHEQRNRPIAQISNILRFTSQHVYIALLTYQCAILNIKAKSKSKPNYEELNLTGKVSADDIDWAYFTCLKYSCPCCET